MDEKICSFFGHREITEKERLYEIAKREILKAIEHGARSFLFGGFGEFDALCHYIVSEICKCSPYLNIKRIFCVPTEKELRKPSRHFNVADYDDIIYLLPSFDGWYKSIYFRNCAMIDKSDFIIFYAENRENSGACKAYKYAIKKKNKTIINIYDENNK